MLTRLIPLPILAAAAIAVPLQAQTAADICQAAFSRMSPGNWAEYQVTNGKDDEATTMRVAMVGTEGNGEGKLYWFESKVTSAQGGMIVKVLIPGWPYDPTQVRQMIMKLGSNPAMRVPQNIIEMMRQRMPSPGLDAMKKCATATVVGPESITVPAGTIATTHLKPASEPGDLWVTNQMPFGLVKWVGARGEVVLLGQGAGAAPMITEEPQDMPGLPMPSRPPPKG